jgi:cytochrome c-type biogenesis protein CcmE
MPPEKEANMQQEPALKQEHGIPKKFIAGMIVIAAAVIYLIVSSTQASAEYFLTVNEVLARQAELAGKNIRLSGVVLGDSIHYDTDSLTLTFTIAHISGNNADLEKAGGLAAALHEAAMDPSRKKITVVYKGVKPDLMKDEAQAIVTGTLAGEGTFSASEVLMKCPTKYEQAVPGQVATP